MPQPAWRIGCLAVCLFPLWGKQSQALDARRENLSRFNIDFTDPRYSGDFSNYTASIIPNETFAWEGWGTSLCWWAIMFGDRADLADLLFTMNETTTLEGYTLPGLGFTIARYNAGASSYEPSNGETMEVSPNMILSRQVFGYWVSCMRFVSVKK